MQYYVVIDTNILVSALLTKHEDASTLRVMRAVFSGVIIPLYHPDMITEYIEVLSRPKFHFKPETIQTMINAIMTNGIAVTPDSTGEILPDMDDLIFYEVTMSERDKNAYLVTGNLKHYPVRNYIIDAPEMVRIIQKNSH